VSVAVFCWTTLVVNSRGDERMRAQRVEVRRRGVAL
jgi:hypothetical protein